MTDPVPEQLRASLGPTYTVEREIGGGGMARVFLARDAALGREVVVKALDPALAGGLSAERFAREVRLAASLQEPHIVPLLSAGTTESGLPYYTMPYVAGRSLRERVREGRLPLDDVVGILHDVARALAYAHGRGVVHRDIKPENVLLSSGTAVVTDFGIAKAVSAARTHEDGAPPAGGTLTQHGIALGTPAYMAPEQATGDAVDARTDLYAWGVLAYELLSGRHPFADRTTAPQLVAAQIAETPPPLASVAPAVPSSLSALVMRCLAKDPAARPASADELVTALGHWRASETPAEARARPARRSWRRVAAGGLFGLVVLSLGGWYLVPVELRSTLRTLVTRPPPTLRVNRVVVAPFEDRTGDPRFAVLGALAADHVAEGLSRLGSLEVVDARTAAATGEVVRRIPRLLRSEDERALGEESGARVVVAGTYYLAGDSVHFRTRILDAESGTIRAALDPVSAPAGSPEGAVAALAARVAAALRAASDENADDLSGLSTPPSLAAYASFREGLQAFLRDQPDSLWLRPLLHAIQLDSTYVTPVVTLAFFSGRQHRFETSDSALARARRLRDRLTREEEALLDVTEATARGDVRAALEASQRTGLPPLVAHMGALARRPRVVIAALRSTDLDRGINIPLAETHWTHLAVAHAQLGDYGAAAHAVREGERRVPRLRARAFEVVFAAARGDAGAVREGLDTRWRAGDLGAGTVARVTTLLRTRGGQEAEGRALATLWADRLLPPTVLDTMTIDPAAAGNRLDGVTDLLAAVGRWRELVRIVDAWEVRAAQDSAAGRVDPHDLGGRRYHLQRRRAAALVHVGRRAEALALDSLWARTTGARWDYGQSALARAGVGAHLGEADRALALLTRAVNEGALGAYWWLLYARGLGTVDGDPLFLPLRDDPRFRALAAPESMDRR